MSDREKSAPLVLIRQARRALFQELISPVPAVIRVLRGRKRAAAGGCTVEAAVGQIVLLPDNVPLAVENIPDDRELYEAEVLTLERRHFEAAYRMLEPGRRPATMQPTVATTISGDLCKSIVAVREGIRNGADTPRGVVDLRCQELAIWLAEAGAILGPGATPNVSGRVREVVSAAPGRSWKAPDLAKHLSMSEATLRRRLRAEGTSFLNILTDVRLTGGLGLLQTTDWTVAAIAQEVGYDSPSRFAARFRSRFGLSPAGIRSNERDFDRNGTQSDRIERVS